MVVGRIGDGLERSGDWARIWYIAILIEMMMG